MSYKLYIPGPVEVSAKTFQAMTIPMYGHRSPDFVALYQRIQSKLQILFGTGDPVYLFTSSSWGAMEAAVRNVTQKKVLNCMCGAFSDKWHKVSLNCGKEAGALRFEWGLPVDPEAVALELATGQYDSITMVHNETSTGMMNPLPELMAVVRNFPEVISVVDAVSSFSAVPLDKDALGIDVLLTGSQKALALPPGLALCSVSQRARDRASTTSGRGFYFDFLNFHQNHLKSMTPSTPSLALIHGLESKLEDIFKEGLENRYARHTRLNAMVHDWVERNDLALFPRKEFASKTLTCVENTRQIDVPEFISLLKKRHNCVIDGGYGKIKGRTFRISNMGDETEDTIGKLLDNLDNILVDI